MTDLEQFTDLPTNEDTEAAAAGACQEQTREPSTWARIDLSDVLDGSFVAPEPELMARTDGHCLLYPGKVHSFQGESESGKSMLAQAEAARALQDGGHVLYLDFESDQATVVGRLLLMGCTPGQILVQFDYRRPDAPLGDPEAAQEWNGMLRTGYTLAVIDGVTEAFSVQGVGSLDNDEVTAWGRMVPRRLAERTGAAVIVVDHVAKNSETRGRFAIGAQAKMSYLTGASYGVEVSEPLGVGMRGVLSVRVGKDRPGRVRPHAGKFRKGDRTQEAAVAVIDSTDPQKIEYTLLPPQDVAQPGTGEVVGFRPTEFMAKVSELIRDEGPQSKRSVRAVLPGKNDTKDRAMEVLEAEGFIHRPTPGAKFEHVRSFPEDQAGETVPRAPSIERGARGHGPSQTVPQHEGHGRGTVRGTPGHGGHGTSETGGARSGARGGTVGAHCSHGSPGTIACGQCLAVEQGVPA